jgi:hypothetical protein
MGFFSWKCAKSNKPVMAGMGVANSPWDFASKVFVFFDNGDRISGTYDGYGRVDDFELTEIDERRWRMVIQKYYSGETFSQLAKNDYDPGQGWFYNDEDLEEIFKE